jgi:hypothetical protein
MEPEQLFLDQLIHKGIFPLLDLALPAFRQVPLHFLHQHLWHSVGIALQFLRVAALHVTLSDQLDDLSVWQVA